MSPSWDSLEQQLSATCWATQAMPSSQKRLGELQLPLTGQLVAQTEKCFLPSYPSLPHDTLPFLPPQLFQAHWDKLFGERTGTNRAGCHLKLCFTSLAGLVH